MEKRKVQRLETNAAKRKRRAKNLRLRWTVQVQWITILEVRGRDMALAFACTETGGKWGVAAFEAPKDAVSPEAIFAQHSHHVVGVDYRDDIEAREAAREYAVAWLAGDEVVELCGCDDIELEGLKLVEPPDGWPDA